MDKRHFDQVVKGVREMKRHMAGKSVRGARTTEITEPDIRAIREAAEISQSQFAKLIGINVRTLQNWEQHRTRPTGPARALLKIVASNPKWQSRRCTRKTCVSSDRKRESDNQAPCDVTRDLGAITATQGALRAQYGV